ncbi:MAG: acyl--CoA ligase [Deltaproteobacteria bacterium]|nr:acyl--CoA ligase [Deltaproteobacteria bacterium]
MIQPAASTALIHDFLETSAALYPGHCAVVCDSGRYTYAHINEAANAMAAELLDLGLQRSDPVVVLCKNGFEYIACYYGILKAGGCVVPVNPGFTAPDIASFVRFVQPHSIIVERALLAGLRECADTPSFLMTQKNGDLPGRISAAFKNAGALDEILYRPCPGNPHLAIDAAGGASIIFTSGSTGRPKGVLLSHKNIVANTRSICRYLAITHGDVQMVVLPFTYVMGKSLLNTHIAAGARVVINNQFAFTAAVLRQMEREQVTSFSGVPSTYAQLVTKSPLREYRDRLPWLRYCSQAGGHMARPVKMLLRKLLPPHTNIVVMYGATEASARLTYLEPHRFHEKIESIGKAIPGVVITIRDERGRELPPGKEGELVAQGDNIMMGYYKDPEATGQVLDSFGYHTGDYGYKDEEGFLFISGRRDELVKVSGYRVNIAEIEECILESGLAIECAVVPVTSDLGGAKLLAMASGVGASVSAADLHRYCMEHLPLFKRPKEIVMSKSIPKNINGKIDRDQCRVQLMNQKTTGRSICAA